MYFSIVWRFRKTDGTHLYYADLKNLDLEELSCYEFPGTTIFYSLTCLGEIAFFPWIMPSFNLNLMRADQFLCLIFIL